MTCCLVLDGWRHDFGKVFIDVDVECGDENGSARASAGPQCAQSLVEDPWSGSSKRNAGKVEALQLDGLCVCQKLTAGRLPSPERITKFERLCLLDRLRKMPSDLFDRRNTGAWNR